jgi:hypothetical protein
LGVGSRSVDPADLSEHAPASSLRWVAPEASL